MNDSYEATFGGPIVRDRLWFFAAAHHASLFDNPTLPITGARIDAPDTNKRGEVKITATVGPSQIVEGSYLNNSRDLTRVTFPFSIDPNMLESPSFPNSRFIAGWRGVLGARVFAEAQYSQKKFGPTSSTRRSSRSRRSSHTTTRRTSTPPIRRTGTTVG